MQEYNLRGFRSSNIMELTLFRNNNKCSKLVIGLLMPKSLSDETDLKYGMKPCPHVPKGNVLPYST